MKKWMLTMVVALAFSCNKMPQEKAPSDTFLVYIGECVTKQNATVCFLEIVDDSRCPNDVDCVWEGVASVRLQLTANGQSKTFVLSTNEVLAGSKKDTVVLGYHIELRDLFPIPNQPYSSTPKVQVVLQKR
jgi:hypothetical protein